LPQRLSVRPQAVYRRAPSDLGAALAQPAPQANQIALGQVALFDRRRIEIGMAAGDQSPARQSEYPATVPGRLERQHQVDHGQTGSNEQGRLARFDQVPNGCSSFVTPWVANEAMSRATEGAEGFRLLVADRKRQGVSVDHVAA